MVVRKKKKIVVRKIVPKRISGNIKSRAKIADIKEKKHAHVPLERFASNPIIAPSDHKHWESKATFNPSAIFGDGKVHLIYRAIGNSDVSVFGYATSGDGFTIEKRGDHPAYFQKKVSVDKTLISPISYSSGGGWNGGAEDPRLTLLGDTVYMLYTSFDGWSSIRIAMTKISFEDFVNQRWNWSPHVYISPPNEINKNWVLFPEKINGKFAILHGIFPKILVEYVDDLDEFDGKTFIKSAPPKGGRKNSWDSWMRGVGPAPIKTKDGWLVLYHAMDINDPNRYKLGAMILDINDPAKIISVSNQPILEPDEVYENEGFKAGVVYACGAVAVDGWLFVYYGGADKVVCVATVKLDLLLKSLRANEPAKLVRQTAKK